VLAASWIEVVDADDRPLGVKRGHLNMPPWPPASAGPLLSEVGEPELALLETNFVSTTSNIAFRRSLLDEAALDFLPLRYTHDWEFILAACRHGRPRVSRSRLSVTASDATRSGQGRAGDRRDALRGDVDGVPPRRGHLRGRRREGHRGRPGTPDVARCPDSAARPCSPNCSRCGRDATPPASRRPAPGEPPVPARDRRARGDAMNSGTNSERAGKRLPASLSASP
jgi:hypothetical protein